MNECLFRVNFVARTTIVVRAKTGLEAESAAIERVTLDGCNWGVENSEVIAECSGVQSNTPKERNMPETTPDADQISTNNAKRP